MEHLHVNALDFFVFLAYLTIAGFLIRSVQITWPESSVSKALSFIF